MATAVTDIFQANLGLATISTANSNLDGTGTLVPVISGASNGTLVKCLIIKAITSTSEGMVRVFVKNLGNIYLVTEVYVPPTVISQPALSFYKVLTLNYLLQSGDELQVSTEKSDTFNVIAEGLDIDFATSATYLGNTVQNIPANGVAVINTANTNLDGSGSVVKVFSAPTSDGSAITSLFIKSIGNTGGGIVRFYLADSAVPPQLYLFQEVIIPPSTQLDDVPAFGVEAIRFGSLCIPQRYEVWASTQVANSFNIICNASSWTNL